jgi:hypothetical protein
MCFHSHSTCPLCRSAVGIELVQTHELYADFAFPKFTLEADKGLNLTFCVFVF